MFCKIIKTAKTVSFTFSHKGRLKKKRPDPTLRCKFGFQNLTVSEIMKTYEGDPEVWTSKFLDEHPEYRLVENSRYLFDGDLKEFFESCTTEDISNRLKNGFREFFDYVKEDEVLKENFLNAKHQRTKDGVYKFIACLLYVFQQDGVDVIRVPRDHHGFENLGFDDTALIIALSYLVSKNIIYTTVGKKFKVQKSSPDGYFDGRTGYVPSFVMFTRNGIKTLEKLYRKRLKSQRVKMKFNGRQIVKGSGYLHTPKELMTKWQQGDAQTRKLMSNGETLWVTEEEAVNMAGSLGVQYSDIKTLRIFYRYCESVITNCHFAYLTSIRAIIHYLYSFLDEATNGNGQIWVKDGSLKRFVKYIMYGDAEASVIKKFSFYV